MDESLQPLAQDLWTTTRPLKFFGLKIDTRMTVIRLGDGGLWIHSPVALTPAILGELQALGPVNWVVAPNRLHHLFLSDYFKVFPKARIYAAPGLAEKRPDLKFHGILGETPEAAWSGQIEQKPIHAFRYLNEVVFFHRPSRTLILTDLLTHFTETSSFGVKLLGRVLGFYDRLGMPPGFKKRIRQRPELRNSLQSVLQWNFQRVIMAHGEVLETGDWESLRKTWDV